MFIGTRQQLNKVRANSLVIGDTHSQVLKPWGCKSLCHSSGHRTNYCNSSFYGLPAVQINKLQRIQNAAARLISNFLHFAHISPILIELHWLPVKYRIIFKIIFLTYKYLNGSTPSYISELISLKLQGGYNLRSCSERLLRVPNDIMQKTMGDRAFAAVAPSEWNKLPSFFKDINLWL